MSELVKPLQAPRKPLRPAEREGVINEVNAEEVEIYARMGTVFDIKGVQSMHGNHEISILDVYIEDNFLVQGPLDISCFNPWGQLYLPMPWGRITDSVPLTFVVHALRTGTPTLFGLVLWGVETIEDEGKLQAYSKKRRDDRANAMRQRKRVENHEREIRNKEGTVIGVRSSDPLTAPLKDS